MTNTENPLSRKEVVGLALIGLALPILFLAGFTLFASYVDRHGGVDVFLAVAALCIIPYCIVITGYSGFLAAKFAQGRWKHTWLWGIVGSTLAILFTFGLPMLFRPLFRYQGPGLFALFGPVVSTLFSMLLISIRRNRAR